MLNFTVATGKVPELAAIFAKHQILETAIQVPGCQTLVLATPDLDGSEAHVIGIWDDEAAYQRWMDHPDRGRSYDDLLQLLAAGYDPTVPAGQWNVLRAIYDADLAPGAAGA